MNILKKTALFSLFLGLVFSTSLAFAAETSSNVVKVPETSVKNISTSIPTISGSEFVNLLIENKGKTIIVNFFATWCPPCIEEIPHLKKISSEYSKDELIIIGLSLDSSMKDLEEFLEKEKLDYPIYIPADNLIAAYRVYSIPHNIVYNKEGKTVYNTSGALTETLLKTILAR